MSEATVSRVLNRRPGVAEQTRAAVLQAVEALGYQHGYGHQLHVAAPPDTVGVLVPELDNPIFAAYAQAIQGELVRRKLLASVCSSTLGAVDERAHLDMLLVRGVVGLVFVSGVHADTTADLSHYTEIVERALPAVFVNGYVPDLPVPFVATDARAAAETAVGHLADLGHRQIGLAVGPRRYTASQQWRESYEQAMVARFETMDPALVVESVYSVEGGRVAGRDLVKKGVSAIVAAGDLMAIGAIAAAREQGLRVPDDVSVVGYDGTPLTQFTDPPLTTLRQPVRVIARSVVTVLMQQVRGVPPPAGSEHLFRAELVVRGSTGPAGSEVGRA